MKSELKLMEPNAEEDRYSDDEEERKKYQRPPSSYGSMKSDTDEEDRGAPGTDEGGLEEIQCDQEVAGVFIPPEPVGAAAYGGAGVQLNRAASPETLYSRTTMQTKPPGAMVIDTRASDIEYTSDIEEEDEEEILITNSPEPPEPIELEDEVQMDVHGQPGRLHPEQDLAHVFKNMQKTLTDLSKEDLYKFKLNFNLRLSSNISLQQMFEGDLLDFVDRIIEMFGLELSLSSTIVTLENISKQKEAEELRANCKKALIRFTLKQEIVRNCQFVFEGIPHPGRHCPIDEVYIEPEICLCTCGGVDPFHEFRNPHESAQSPDSVVSLNNMFRLQRPDGQPVRTAVTTGIAGVGMSMSAAKYSYDWAEHRANKDLQYVITLPFSSLWILRNKQLSSSDEMSIMDVIEYHHSLCKSKKYLDDEDCKFLLLMDSFDCYQTLLDWTNTPVINDHHAPAKLDDLIVNLVRGSLFPNAQIWILGRQAAVSRIPQEYIDAFTEIHGFNNEMKDHYLRSHFTSPELGNRVVSRYKQLPMLRALTRQPFLCWMVSQLFGQSFRRYENYGIEPPKLTPFYANTVVIQTNRRLQFYYEKPESNMNWSDDDSRLLTKLGCMALKMLQLNTTEFSEEEVKMHDLDVMDVTVFSGLCTELPQASAGKRRFCFIHTTFQEFMAALYVFLMFRLESKNALEPSRGALQVTALLPSRPQARSSADIVQSALKLTFNSPLGRYDLFLRFLCGLLSPDNNKLLAGNLFSHNHYTDMALLCPEVKELLWRTMQTCPADRRENIQECYRELTQEIN